MNLSTSAVRIFSPRSNLLSNAIVATMVLATATFTNVANATESFWQAPQTQSISGTTNQTLSGGSASDLSASLYTSKQVDIDGLQTELSSVSLTQNFTDQTALSFEYANSRDQRNVVLGFTHNNLSVSMLNGSGEDYASLAGDYTGVDPYTFHGGFKQDFRTQGFALDYGFGRFGHLQFGEAKVQASGLADRSARYMEWSNTKMFARATRFARGNDEIGSGFDLGFAFGSAGNKLLALQAMELDNERKLQRIRLQFNGKKSRQYWLDLSAHQNPLFKANDDYRLMFNFKTLLGTKHLASYQNESGSGGQSSEEDAIEDESGSPTAKKKGKKGNGWKRAVFIGGGIAAAAALSSSGSSAADDNTRFRSQRDAAFEVLNGINPRSVRENREYGGWIYVGVDGNFASTTPVPGEAASVSLPNPALAIPSGGRLSATYHTHAAFDPRFDNENFSPTDLESDRSIGVDGYLATPGGQFKFHNVSTGEIQTLGSIATM